VILAPPACNQIFCKYSIISIHISKKEIFYFRKTLDIFSSTLGEKKKKTHIVENYSILGEQCFYLLHVNSYKMSQKSQQLMALLSKQQPRISNYKTNPYTIWKLKLH
jgi:hypothetical protein